METIGKQDIKRMSNFKASKVDIERRCENCACFNGKDWCQLHQHSTRKITYGCKTHLTQAELDRKTKEAEAYLESQDGIRVNYMLTLMFAMVSASYQIMITGEAMLGRLIGGKEWRFERKKALKDMMQCIEKIKSLYSTYFEKDYIQMMSDYGREEFDSYTYDGFQMFASDLLQLGLTYFEHGYRNNEILHEIIDFIRTKPTQLDLFSPEFIKRFEIKANNDD